MKRFLEFFEDDTGKLSATRMAFIITIHTILFAWLFSCIRKGEMISFDPNSIYLILTLMVGKVSQSWVDNKFLPKTLDEPKV